MESNFVEDQQEKHLKDYHGFITKEELKEIVSDTIIDTCEEIQGYLCGLPDSYVCKQQINELINQAKESNL